MFVTYSSVLFFIIISGFINSLPFRVNIFVFAVGIVRLYFEATQIIGAVDFGENHLSLS